MNVCCKTQNKRRKYAKKHKMLGFLDRKLYLCSSFQKLKVRLYEEITGISADDSLFDSCR